MIRGLILLLYKSSVSTVTPGILYATTTEYFFAAFSLHCKYVCNY
jgi:hypothetical protein